MIKVNDIEIKVNHFPDGSMMLLDVCVNYDLESYKIKWCYRNDEELLTLIYIVNHIRQNANCAIKQMTLYMPYIPNARMDRVKNSCEVFTLKYFCDIINSLHFDKVYVLDPHSHVSEALINNIHIYPIDSKWLNDTVGTFDTVYFPDESAKKRYEQYFPLKTLIFGKKKRDWRTGKILGVETCSDCFDITQYRNKDILIVDDIISKGGSIYYGLMNLIKDHGEPNSISIYASHVENSIIEGDLWREFIANGKATLYTTNSIDRKYKLIDFDECNVNISENN